MNVVSVAMYLTAYYLVQRRRVHFAVMPIWLEAFPYAAIGTIMLGWESGFHYLLLMFISSVAMTASRWRLQVFLIALSAAVSGKNYNGNARHGRRAQIRRIRDASSFVTLELLVAVLAAAAGMQ